MEVTDLDRKRMDVSQSDFSVLNIFCFCREESHLSWSSLQIVVASDCNASAIKFKTLRPLRTGKCLLERPCRSLNFRYERQFMTGDSKTDAMRVFEASWFANPKPFHDTMFSLVNDESVS